MTHDPHDSATGRDSEPYADGQLMLTGAAGQVEAQLSYPKGFSAGDRISVVCHPHPLYGGSMGNKVVHMVAAAFKELGVATLRFNFRGVGDSEGQYDEGRGESDDLIRIAEQVRERHPGSPLWLAGFSFGAYVALRACGDVVPERLLLVAPPVSLYDFSVLPPIEVPAMVIQGGQDEVIDPAAVEQWLASLSSPPEFHRLDEADHFFHGQLIRLRETIVEHWGQSLSQRSR
ncbi:MAG: alpha/beta fold hydrolase [Gammaproteobacteria bacterium]|nr:alpha/beta fold hydrolase [Gammaproteobacteria bacterium]